MGPRRDPPGTAATRDLRRPGKVRLSRGPRRAAAALAGALACCAPADPPAAPAAEGPYVLVLGVAQDGGRPQAGCVRACCRDLRRRPELRRHAASLAVVDPGTSERWILDVTPDFPEQLRALDEAAPVESRPGLSGVFLTHAHVGHYAGLIHLGHEVMGARDVAVHVMPRMDAFLRGAGPWDQLVGFGNVSLRPLQAGRPVTLNERVRITPFLVPHRDEYSETVGFRIDGPRRSVVYLPDIDKWEHWDRPVEELLEDVDVAYVDGTFFDGDELPGRDLSRILHPFITESMERWSRLEPRVRSRVRFLHMNHTNPCLDPGSPAARRVAEAGFRIALEGERVAL